ncbi:MAG: glycosidase [Acholeplasmatales bacterium]|nr:MAG: glycosidase [Acholeplasmatales bacterium]
MDKQLIVENIHVRATRDDFEVVGVFNPAVIRLGDETVMIARVAESVVQNHRDHYLVPFVNGTGNIEMKSIPKQSAEYDYSDLRIIRNEKTSYLTSISHFRVARSTDGVTFDFNGPVRIFPETIYEEYGIEDPRITCIDDVYYITYTAVSRHGINVGLMRTVDFERFERLGIIFHPDNKDVVIFPEKVKGRYFALHRPSLSAFGRLDIWTAESSNLISWGNHKVMVEAVPKCSVTKRIGAGAVPFLTEKGWVVVYHGADAQSRYYLTVMLLDKDDPNKVLAKSRRPLLEPTEPFERLGFMNDVVFTCGLVVDEEAIRIYYGVCDQSIACCTVSMDELWSNLEV